MTWREWWSDCGPVAKTFWVSLAGVAVIVLWSAQPWFGAEPQTDQEYWQSVYIDAAEAQRDR